MAKPAGRLGIIAGGGSLPLTVARSAVESGERPYVVLVEGEVENPAAYAGYDAESFAMERIGEMIPVLRRNGVSRLVMAGAIKRRPKLSQLKWNRGLAQWIVTAAIALARGDNALLSAGIRKFERNGIRVLGAHEIVPDLTPGEGVLTRAKPAKADWSDIRAARKAAMTIGELDIGQAAVSIGGRVIALEGIEGTDGLLQRVRELRPHGRLAGRTGGVLAKCVKPQQDHRADLPSIGPDTVEAAHAARLNGIVIDAGHSLMIDRDELIARADKLGLFVFGHPPGDA